MTVYNMRDKNKPTDGVYIGRPRGEDSPENFSNPFGMKGTKARVIVESRGEAVSRFSALVDGDWDHVGQGLAWDVKQKINEDADWWRKKHEWMNANLHTIVGRDLICFCAPKACHGDVLERKMKQLGLMKEKKLKIIAFTGHRELTQQQTVNAALGVMSYLKAQQAEHGEIGVLLGMAAGVDQIVAHACVAAGIKFTACIPHPAYPSHYSKLIDRKIYDQLLLAAHKRVYVKGSKAQAYAAESAELRETEQKIIASDTDVPFDWRFNFSRNEYMVDKADVLCAVTHLGDRVFDPASNKQKGGTEAAIRYAQKVRKPIDRIDI